MGTSAGKTFGQAIESFGKAIGVKANEYCTHAGRKTVNDEDVKLAAKDLGYPIE